MLTCAGRAGYSADRYVYHDYMHTPKLHIPHVDPVKNVPARQQAAATITSRLLVLKSW
jgi:hypothetical protein